MRIDWALLLLLAVVLQYCDAVPLYERPPPSDLAVDPKIVADINSDTDTEW